MTIVDSLKKLLTKFGGNASALEENATSSDVIDAIADAYTDKEGTYVEVTPIENKGTKIATITTNNTPHDIYAGINNYYLANSVSGTSVTLTKDTLADIAGLYFSGKQILLEILSSGINSILSLSTCDISIPFKPEDPQTYKYVFTGIFVDGDDNKIITVTFNNSTTGTMSVKTVPAGGSDNFIVNLTEAPGTGTTCDKSINDIIAAYNSGKNVIAIANFGGLLNKRLTCTTAYSEENVGADVLFLAMNMGTGGDYIYYTGVKGRIVDGVDTWNTVQPVWDNS